MSKICFIAGAGSADGAVISPTEGDFVIAADGGLAWLDKAGVSADLVVGDFDSLGHAPCHPHVVRHSPEKDETDTALAIDEGLRRGYGIFYITGGLGGRLDHTLGNFQMLVRLARLGKTAFLVGDGMVITALHEKKLRLSGRSPGTLLSVFCAGDRAEGVCISGLKYRLENAEMTCDETLGVSNEFTGTPAEISVLKGTLLILWYQRDFHIRGDDAGFLPL